MFFDFSLKSSLLLIFFLHGLVFSALLFIKSLQTTNKSNYWLGLFTVLCSLYISPFMLGYAGWYSKLPYRDILFYIPFQQLFLLPPVLYFYFKTLLDKSFSFSRKDFIHFLPAILYFIYSLIVFITDKIVLNEYYFYNDGKDKDLSGWYQIAGFLSLAWYLIQSLKLYKKYKRLTYNTVSFADSIMFKWSQMFLIAFLLLLTIRGLFFIINPEWDEFGKKFWYYLFFSILFYYISISGYVNSVRSITSFRDVENNSDSAPSLNTMDVVEHSEDLSTLIIENPPDGRNEIPDLELWKEKIENLMLIDKLFENPELSISDLSAKMGTHSKRISQVINQGFNMNFNDFVNHYRAKALIKKIENGEHNTQTLLGIAFDCGFNSKSTFNRAFKRYTSLSPNEYIKKNYAK